MVVNIFLVLYRRKTNEQMNVSHISIIALYNLLMLFGDGNEMDQIEQIFLQFSRYYTLVSVLRE